MEKDVYICITELHCCTNTLLMLQLKNKVPCNHFSYIVAFTFYTWTDILRNIVKFKYHLLLPKILRSKTFKRGKDK